MPADHGRPANEMPVTRTAPAAGVRERTWVRRPRIWLLGGVGLGLYGAVMWIAWIYVLPSYVIGLGLLPFRALAVLFGMILGLRSGG